MDHETTKLLGAYLSLQDEHVRKGIRDLVRELGGGKAAERGSA